MSESDILQRIEEKVDKIQSDVNINTAMHKELNKTKLKDQIMEKFGTGATKKKIWYYAESGATISELAEKVGSSESYLRNILPEMDEDGLLNKKRENGNVKYMRNRTFNKVGIKDEIEDQVDDL